MSDPVAAIIREDGVVTLVDEDNNVIFTGSTVQWDAAGYQHILYDGEQRQAVSFNINESPRGPGWYPIAGVVHADHERYLAAMFDTHSIEDTTVAITESIAQEAAIIEVVEGDSAAVATPIEP